MSDGVLAQSAFVMALGATFEESLEVMSTLRGTSPPHSGAELPALRDKILNILQGIRDRERKYEA